MDPQSGRMEEKIYGMIVEHDGIRARDIASSLHTDHTTVNRCLYRYPFIHDLCVRDDQYLWHGLIRRSNPHTGLSDFCGWYGSVSEFLAQTEEEWLAQLTDGCRRIGRNLNDTRGLIHSFKDCCSTMTSLFKDLSEMSELDASDWELCFEVRIKRGRWIRIYTDVLLIAGEYVFALEFKMKDAVETEELRQAAKYVPYLEVIFGESCNVVPVLVLTRAEDLFRYETLPGTTAEVPTVSGDMLFNVILEYCSEGVRTAGNK